MRFRNGSEIRRIGGEGDAGVLVYIDNMPVHAGESFLVCVTLTHRVSQEKSRVWHVITLDENCDGFEVGGFYDWDFDWNRVEWFVPIGEVDAALAAQLTREANAKTE